MTKSGVRVVHRAPRLQNNNALLVVLVMLIPLFAPIQGAEAEARIESQDFEILDRLSDVLDNRQQVLDSNSVGQMAGPAIQGVKDGISPSGQAQPLSSIGDSLEGSSFTETMPSEPEHSLPYRLILGIEDDAVSVDNVWQTLVNITDYVILTEYTDLDGNVVTGTEVVTFTANFLSLINLQTDPLSHAVDIDNDGDDDIQVGLSISLGNIGLDNIDLDTGTLWIQPSVSYSVDVLDSSQTDSVWDEMDSLQVSLIKSFAYSSPDSVLALGDGESYIWVVDSRFSTMPQDFSLSIGIERIFFNASAVLQDLIQSLVNIFASDFDGSGLTLIGISAPYSISIDSSEMDSCPDRYSPEQLLFLPPEEIDCGVSVGLGYARFSPPSEGVRQLWELAYIDLDVKPNGVSSMIPGDVELVIRTDSTIPAAGGIEGDRSLTTVEYFADRRSDIHIHFFEDRAGVPAEDNGGSFGNTTESLGWLRGMPEGSMSQGEITRIFRMLGSSDEPDLPGGKPSRLGLILGIKNFSRDTSPNEDDPTLPVNPAYPPISMILLRSAQPLDSLDYTSWFERGGESADHRRVDISIQSIPTALVLFGSFDVSGSDDAQISLDDSNNLDFVSRIMDSLILNLVDLYLDVGGILNSIPTTVVEAITGSVGPSGDLQGREFNLLMHDNWGALRNEMAIGRVGLQIGSSPHPIILGDHLVLSKDKGLTQVVSREGTLVDPLVPVAASIGFSGLSAFSIDDDDILDELTVSVNTSSSEPFNFVYIDHEPRTISNSSYQALAISDIPDDISIMIDSETATYTASQGMGKITYTGKDLEQRQAVEITDFPNEFTAFFGGFSSWSTTSSIGMIEAQITDSQDPETMSGDHFMFHHDPNDGTSTISSRISGISEVSWIPPISEGSLGPDGRGKASISASGDRSMSLSVDHAPTLDEDQLTAVAIIDPLPSSVSIEIPTSSDSGPALDIPELNTSLGLSGLAFFLGGFADLGRSVNTVLSGITTDISTGANSGESSEDFSFGMQLEANAPFDLVVESSHGNGSLEAPPWVHGVSFNAAPSGISDGFHLRTWIPDLPPVVDMSVSRSVEGESQDWHVMLALDGWIPAHSEMMIQARGINGQDLLMTLNGLEVGTPTGMLIDSTFEFETVAGITEVSTSAHYSMTERLDWAHVLLINRDAGSRTEIMIDEIPEVIDITASLGTAVSIDMTVPDQYLREDGVGINSIMMQQMQWLDSAWWPATIFLTDVPGSINLTTEPDTNFDITQSLAFQGIPILDYRASGEGMSLYIEAFGRSINTKGDIILLAEGLSDSLVIKPADGYGLNIRSGGDGVDTIYIRSSNIPTTPPVTMEEMEALGENLKSATIHIHELGRVSSTLPGYPVIELSDVQGGKIIISARASAEFAGQEFDLRGVLLDAQTTSGIPTATTIGVNGLASDLSILNIIPGFEGETQHIMVVEPVSSGIMTLIATFLGGS
tara:strand:+ start:45 stop:4442 length:4398 start_codon:yes stop_codon:yes gene_type:complete